MDKRRHAKGYTDYARLDSLRYHRAQTGGGLDTDGTPLCVCSYPLVPTENEKQFMREREQKRTEESNKE